MGEVEGYAAWPADLLVGDPGGQVLDPHPQLPTFRGVGVDPDLAVCGSIAIGVEDQSVLDHAARGVKG